MKQMDDTNAGVRFEEVTLDTLESNDGLLLKDELAKAIKDLAAKVVDERYAKTGKITVTVDMRRAGETMVALGVDVTAKEPKAIRRSVMAMRNREGKLVTTDHKQESLPLAPVRSIIQQGGES